MARPLRLAPDDVLLGEPGVTAVPDAPFEVDPADAVRVLGAVGGAHAVALVEGTRCPVATPALARLVGSTVAELAATGLTGPGAREVREQSAAVAASGRPRTGVVLAGAGGSTWRAGFHPVAGTSAVAVVATDLTELLAEVEALRHDASHDPLTGLLNRRELTERLDAALARAARRTDSSVAVVFLDLDGFKSVNDRWGHAVGDAVLAAVAHRLAAVVRAGDVLSRVGGDEFVLLRKGEDEGGRLDLEGLRTRVDAAVAEPVAADGVLVTVGISLGVALARPGQRGADVVDAADRAMYAGRRARTHGLPALRRPRALPAPPAAAT